VKRKAKQNKELPAFFFALSVCACVCVCVCVCIAPTTTRPPLPLPLLPGIRRLGNWDILSLISLLRTSRLPQLRISPRRLGASSRPLPGTLVRRSPPAMAATTFPLLLLLLIILSSSARADPDAVVSRIAFGSCANQSEPQVVDGTPRPTRPCPRISINWL